MKIDPNERSPANRIKFRAFPYQATFSGIGRAMAFTRHGNAVEEKHPAPLILVLAPE